MQAQTKVAKVGAHWATDVEIELGLKTKVGPDGYPYELLVGMIPDGYDTINGVKEKVYATKWKWYLPKGKKFYAILNAHGVIT